MSGFLDGIAGSNAALAAGYRLPTVTGTSIAVQAGWMNTVISGAAAGFSGNLAGSGGDFEAALKGGLTGAMSAGITAGFGTTYDVSRFLAQTAVGCASAEIGGGNCGEGAATAAAMATLATIAHEMRQSVIDDSSKFKGICDSQGNCLNNLSGKSVGVDGDMLKGAGSRAELDKWTAAIKDVCDSIVGGCEKPDMPADLTKEVISLPKQITLQQVIDKLEIDKSALSPFGGIQGSQGYLFGSTYDPGSFKDKLLESFGGAHDFFNSFHYYDSIGNNLGGVTEIWNKLDLFLAAPFAFGTLSNQYPGIFNNALYLNTEVSNKSSHQ